MQMPPRKANFSLSKSKKNGRDLSMGSMRFLADKRQFAGLLMLTGFAAVIMPLYQISTAIEGDGKTVTTGLSFASLIGSVVVLATGIVSVFVGYGETVHDCGSTKATLVAILLSQCVWLAYITSMVDIGMQASSGNAFIPKEYSYTADDVALIGAMGILGVAAYGFSLVGAIAFFQFAVYAFQADRPYHRNASYFRSRQRFYAFILYVAGIDQFALGAYCYFRFGDLMKMHGPIIVGFYVVSYPTLTMFAGVIQLVLGSWCFLRTFGYFIKLGKEHYFTLGMGVGWLAQLGLQVLPQIGVVPGSVLAGLSAAVTAFGFGLSLMPAYLDYKTRTTLETILPDYYGLEDPSESAPRTASTQDSISDEVEVDVDLEDPPKSSVRVSSRTPSQARGVRTATSSSAFGQ